MIARSPKLLSDVITQMMEASFNTFFLWLNNLFHTSVYINGSFLLLLIQEKREKVLKKKIMICHRTLRNFTDWGLRTDGNCYRLYIFGHTNFLIEIIGQLLQSFVSFYIHVMPRGEKGHPGWQASTFLSWPPPPPLYCPGRFPALKNLLISRDL